MQKYKSFQDIPQFPRSYWQVNIGWDRLWQQLLDLMVPGLDMAVNMDPPYQRGYVWSEAQKSRYVEFLLMGGTSGRDLYLNCPNWHLRRPLLDNWDNTVELVDGKQRIGAIVGFMGGVVPAFGAFFGDYTGVLRMQHVSMTIHVGCLETPLEVVDWYLGMNNGGTAHTEADLRVALDYRATLL